VSKRERRGERKGRRGRRREDEQLVLDDGERSTEPEEHGSVEESEESFGASVSHGRPRSPLEERATDQRTSELREEEERKEKEGGGRLTFSAVLAWCPELRRPTMEMGEESLDPNRGREDLETADRNMDMARGARDVVEERGRSTRAARLAFPFFSWESVSDLSRIIEGDEEEREE